MSKKGVGFFSKILTSLAGIQNDTEPHEGGGNDLVVSAPAETSSGVTVTVGTGRFVYPTITTTAENIVLPVQNLIGGPGGLPNKRRKLYTDEKKKEDERKYQIEININEWKKSLKDGYEFDHMEAWPLPENESRCTALPENHPSTKAMYVVN
jgi:hypothetical protein